MGRDENVTKQEWEVWYKKQIEEELDSWNNPPKWKRDFQEREIFYYTTDNPTLTRSTKED